MDAGTSILHYRIVRPIGSGGMGVVYEAEDTKLGRHVALKFLPASLAGDRPALERFQREARAASALNHPNICTVHAFEESDGQHFIVMELLDGHSLDRRLGDRPMSWDAIVDTGMQVADALDAAHHRGIVHRDIKPANIFLTRDGRAKVLDFGVATVTAAMEGNAETVGMSAAAAKLTGPGVAVGTIAYMSPEQARAEPLDARSDLFSLSAVLYEMATARPAFAGKTTAVIFQQILGGEPEPPRRVNAALPPKLDEIIVKGLEKDQELRYQTAADLRGDLRRLKRDVSSGKVAFVEEAGTPSRALSSGTVILSEAKRHKGLTAALAALMLVTMAAAAYGISAFVTRDRASAPPAAAAATPTRLTTHGEAQGCGAISPDGKYVVYCTFAGELRAMQVATGSTVVLGMYRGVSTFSPDGDYVLIAGQTDTHPNGALFRIPVFGGDARTVVTNIIGAPAISPDGKRLAFLRGFMDERRIAVMTADADGSNERRLLTGTAESWLEYPGLAWSPDGQWLAGPQASTAGGYHVRPVAIEVSTGKIESLGTRTFSALGRLAWLPGNVVLFSAPERVDGSDQFWTVRHPGGEPVRLTNDARGFGNISVGVTADGSTIATIPVDLVSNIWGTNADATEPLRQWTSGARNDGEDDIRALDSGPIFYSSSDAAGEGIWRVDAPGVAPRKLTTIPAGAPSTPDDGRFVAFAGRHENRARIWRMQPDGSGARLLTTGDEEGNARVSPDGAWIYFASHPGISRVSAEGGAVTRVHDLAYPLDVSPDGSRLLAGLPLEGNAGSLVVIDARTGKVLQDVPVPSYAVFSARWGRSRDVVAYVADRDNVGNLWEQSLSGGPPRQLTKFTDGEIFGFGYSPDRKRLFLGRGNRTGDVYLLRNFR